MRGVCSHLLPRAAAQLWCLLLHSLSCLDNERGLLLTACSSARSTGPPAPLQGLKSSLGTVKST